MTQKTKLGDLDNHIFAQLDRLGQPDLSSEAIEMEVKRAGGIVALSDQIISMTKLKLEAAKLYANHGPAIKDMLAQIGKTPDEGGGQ